MLRLYKTILIILFLTTSNNLLAAENLEFQSWLVDFSKEAKKKGISEDDENFLYWLNTDWYSDTKVDIVNETYYLEDDQCHLTEKIFKPMMLEKPFVVNGTKGYLKELKRLGFKTFSDVIDESYDDASNEIRYKLVVDAAIELAGKYNTDKVKQICKYNKKLFFNISHKKDIVKKLFISQLKTDGLLQPKQI